MRSFLLNWGSLLGTFQRVVIILISIWTFIFNELDYVVGKGLVLRQLVFLVLIFVVPYFAYKNKISIENFPFKTDAILLIPLFIDTLGNFFGRLAYGQFGYMDKVAHFIGSGVFTFLAFVLITSYLHSYKIKPRILTLVILGIAVGFALEGLWEIWEYYYDLTYNTYLVNDLADTIGDMVASFIGSLIISLICSLWYSSVKEETREKYLFTLSRLFG